MEVQEMIEKIHGDRVEKDRALLAVNAILAILHPKFDKAWEEDDYFDDGEGYVEDFQWTPNTIEAVDGILLHYGFGIPSSIKHELGLSIRAMEDEDDDED